MSKSQRYIFHPLVHSLKTFAYVLGVNIIFGIAIYFVGEDNIASFLVTNRYFAPLLAVLVGIVPNCAASVILVNLYLMGGIGFGACLGGLCINAGLGLLFLFRKKGSLRENLIILSILLIVSIVAGYLTSLVFNFA
jgi:hypothetical protein